MGLLAGTGVLVGIATRSRWPQLLAAIISLGSCLLSAGVVLNPSPALLHTDTGGYEPHLAGVGSGAVVAMVLSAALTIIAFMGFLQASRGVTLQDRNAQPANIIAV